MATMQMQKTRNAKTFTKTAIDQKQSLEVVQTMLHGSLSTLSYLRNFFAERAFDKQAYEMAEQIHPYEDYAASNLIKDRSEASQPATAIQTLQRGRSKRVDMFLDWLENGAFPALQAGHLQALQIYVHAEPNDRSKVIEMYTFTIKYDNDAANSTALAGLELDAPGSPLVSVYATNSALQSLLRQLMEVCERLPDLPARRYISMELFNVSDVDKQPKIADFVPGTSDRLQLPEAEGWEQESKTTAELNSLFHGSALRVTSLVPTAGRHLASPPPSTFPEEYQYSGPTSKIDSVISAATDLCAVEHPVKRPGSENAAADTTPSTVIETVRGEANSETSAPHTFENGTNITPTPSSNPVVVLADQVSVVDSPHAKPAILDASTLGDSLNTQSSSTADMKNAVRHMMQPEHITQGDTQTQSPLHQPLPTQSESTESPDRLTASPAKIARIVVGTDKPLLSPTKAQELKRNETRLHKHALELVKQTGRKIRKGDTVLCQCGHAKEEDDMVQCEYCKTWQHLPCYGYTAVDDPRLPDEHTCYQCLLGEEEKLTLKKLQALAIKRRAMDFALQHGLKTQKDLADDLELESAVAQQVLGDLKSSGFVVPASGSHKAGYNATGKALFVPVRDGPKHELMLQSLFDPLIHISHHYQLPAKPFTQLTSLTQRLLASQANDMPPPATPASQLRKRNAMTPASGLDLRASMAFETPSRPRTQQAVPQKRSSTDAGRVDSLPERLATPSSTFKRVRCMQSRCVIDANGLSSSPVEGVYGR